MRKRFPTFILGSGVALCIPSVVSAMTFAEFTEMVSLFMHGGIGFFGALAVLIFAAGYVVYLARMGQEYRLEGIYLMLKGVRILFYIVIAAALLKLIA